MAFTGFPNRIQFTAVPKGFFSALLAEMNDLLEMKALLFVFWALSQKRGHPRLVSLRELLGHRPVAKAFGSGVLPAEAGLRESLAKAVGRGVLLHASVERDGQQDDVYLLNTEAGRWALERIPQGEIDLGVPVVEEGAGPTLEKPNIFTLYERNIGLLTPLMVEELKEAERTYPPQWIEDAFQEAVAQNVRKWRYILRILERWAAEGRGDEGYRRGAQGDGDPYRYIKGRFGHLIKH